MADGRARDGSFEAIAASLLDAVALKRVARAGWVRTERGAVTLTDMPALRRLNLRWGGDAASKVGAFDALAN